jgi:heme oxygenase (mycobilin-producing)
MSGQVRVLVYHAAADDAAIGEAYHQVSRAMAHVPGMLGNELLRSLHNPTCFVVVSRWAGIDAFQQWEQGPDHLDITAPLRPFRDPRMTTPFGIYRVTATY